MGDDKTIKILDKDTINKIAAGEVIERPASVVKELVDNAIDAGAKNIRIDLEDAGKRSIVVKDDGKGMSRENAVLCPLKHATSKISTADDLVSVRTMGFRGEALSSISAIAKFEIVTKRKEDSVGTHLVMDGGNKVNVCDVGAADGTTVFVTDLFCNTPVRKKYLKSDATELSHIIRTVGDLILANRALTITLSNNGRKIISSPSSTLLNAISDVMGPETAKTMIPLRETADSDTSGIRIEGYISKPVFNRGTPEHITFIVNGRPVSSKELMGAVRLGYYTKIPNNRYPAAVIRIDMAPESVDVNVHPRKTEVRFADEKELVQEITKRIEETLRQTDLSANVTTEKARKIVDRSFSDFGSRDGTKMSGAGEKKERDETRGGTGDDTDSDTKDSPAGMRQAQPSSPALPGRDAASETPFSLAGTSPGNRKASDRRPAGESGSALPDVPVQRDAREKYGDRYIAPVLDTDRRLIRSSRMIGDRTAPAADVSVLEGIRLIGQISALYILAETPEGGLLIIDQHAAHERVFYDLFRKAEEKQTQELIAPVVLRLSPREKSLIEEYIPALEQVGFGVSEFGENDFVVNFVPLVFGRIGDAAIVREIISDLFESGSVKTAEEARDLILKRMACRAAIKAGADCTPEQMKNVIDQLRSADHPYACPHGRPTIIAFSKKEIEKLFERI